MMLSNIKQTEACYACDLKTVGIERGVLDSCE